MKITCKKNAAVVVLLGLSLLIGASFLYAQLGHSSEPGFGNPEERALMVSLYLTKKLDLSTSQQQELGTITQALLQKGKVLHDMRMSDREQLVSILRADSVDAQQIQLLQSQHQQVINDFITEAGNRLTEFVNMLSPEQRQSLANLIEDHSNCCAVH
jgi:Spy/CpxP family protein refolding chaperone